MAYHSGLTPLYLAQVNFWDLVVGAKPMPMAVMILLLGFSVLSWTLIFSRWSLLRRTRAWNTQFLRAFRQAQGMAEVAAAAEGVPKAPLVGVFGFGYEEIERQVKARGSLTNKPAVERALQMGVSEEMAVLERHMNWLATTASVTPFIGLFGTVWGIIDSFSALGLAGSASLRAVAPGIAQALVATALGLGAAIPAAIFYNHFAHLLREMGARMEDFSLEFMNLAERTFGE